MPHLKQTLIILIKIQPKQQHIESECSKQNIYIVQICFLPTELLQRLPFLLLLHFQSHQLSFGSHLTPPLGAHLQNKILITINKLIQWHVYSDHDFKDNVTLHQCQYKNNNKSHICLRSSPHFYVSWWLGRNSRLPVPGYCPVIFNHNEFDEEK